MTLKELRLSKGLNQTQLAKKIGMSQTNYSYYETNNIMPDSKTLIKLAELYGITVDSLLGVEPVYDMDGLVEYQVIGTIRAGYEGDAEEVPTGETIPIPKDFLKGYKKDDFFILSVSGDSMYPKFLSGDYVLVHRQTSVDSGDTACVLYNDTEATIKVVKYVSGENWLELVPINPEYPIKRIENDMSCRVLGKVVKLIRNI